MGISLGRLDTPPYLRSSAHPCIPDRRRGLRSSQQFADCLDEGRVPPIVAAQQAARLHQRLPRLNIRLHVFIIMSGVNENHIKPGLPARIDSCSALPRQVSTARMTPRPSMLSAIAVVERPIQEPTSTTVPR